VLALKVTLSFDIASTEPKIWDIQPEEKVEGGGGEEQSAPADFLRQF